jgi:uncharacterized protein YkwD
MTRRTWLLLAATKQDLAQAVFARVNQERKARGLAPLAWNSKLAAAARQHSERMTRRGQLSHVDPEYGDTAARLDRFGITWSACAENLSQETGFQDPVHQAVEGWLQSPGHRKNLLGRVFTQTGVGAAVSSRGTVTFTQIFLAP